MLLLRFRKVQSLVLDFPLHACASFPVFAYTHFVGSIIFAHPPPHSRHCVLPHPHIPRLDLPGFARASLLVLPQRPDTGRGQWQWRAQILPRGRTGIVQCEKSMWPLGAMTHQHVSINHALTDKQSNTKSHSPMVCCFPHTCVFDDQNVKTAYLST